MFSTNLFLTKKKKAYWKVDVAINRSQQRITDKASSVIHAIERIVIAGWKGEEVSQEDLKSVSSFYSDDLDSHRRKAQLAHT